MGDTFWWFVAICLTAPFWFPVLAAVCIAAVGVVVMLIELIRGR